MDKIDLVKEIDDLIFQLQKDPDHSYDKYQEGWYDAIDYTKDEIEVFRKRVVEDA